MTVVEKFEEPLWRWRWLQCIGRGSSTLHRVLSYKRLDESGKEVAVKNLRGVITVCGLSRRVMIMPGILSRMEAPRCRVCCRRLKIPVGEGAPFNTLTGADKNA